MLINETFCQYVYNWTKVNSQWSEHNLITENNYFLFCMPVLLCIFSYLDDLSLCACACVCARWWRLVRARVAPPRWAAFAARRWPLFRPLRLDIDWHEVINHNIG